MDLGGAGVAHHAHERARRGAPHDRVVDDDHALPAHVVVEHVELQLHALATQLVGRLDEGAADVAVLDETLVVFDAAGRRVADGGRGRGVGHRDDDVGVDGVLAGQFLAETMAGVVNAQSVPAGVRAGEVDVLERAASLLLRGGHRPVGARDLALEHDDLPRLDLADLVAPEGLEGPGLRRDDVSARRQPAERQGPEPPRITGGDHLGARDDHEAERPFPARHDRGEALLPRAALGLGQGEGDHLGVGGRLQPEAALEQADPERVGVDQVAVVGDAERTVHRLDDVGLHVAIRVGTGGRVAGVTDRQVPDEGVELVGPERLADQTLVLRHPHDATVGHGDAGGLLASVLQGVEAEEGEFGCVVVGR